MLKWSLKWGIMILCIILACTADPPSKTDNTPTTKMDSLAFSIQHPDVLNADALLEARDLSAIIVYDSLLLEGISDKYLRHYIRTQELYATRNDLEEEDVQNSLDQLEAELAQFSTIPFLLQLQLDWVNGRINYENGENLEIIKRLDYLKNVPIRNYTEGLNKQLFKALKLLTRTNAFRLEDYYRAKDWGLMQLKMSEFIPDLSNQDLGILHYYLAVISRNLDDNELALSYSKKSVELLKKAEPVSFVALTTVMAEQANIYGILLDNENAEITFSGVMDIAKEGNVDENRVFAFIRNYAGVQFHNENLPSFRRMVGQLEQYMDPFDTTQLAQVIERKGWVSNLEEDFDRQLVFQQSAFELYNTYSEKEDRELKNYLTNLGTAYFDLEQYDSAVYYFHKGLEKEFLRSFPISNPPSPNSLKSYREFEVDLGPLSLSLQKSDFPTGSIAANRKLANRYYDIVFKYFDKYKKGREEGAILKDLNSFYNIFGEAIYCKFNSELNDQQKLEEIFEIMEKGKALLLYQSVHLRVMADQYGLPDSVFQALINVNQRITSFDDKQLSDGDSEEILEARGEKQRILSLIKSKYKEFYNASRSPEQIDLDRLQKSIEDNQLMIQYYWSTQGLFAMAIGANDVNIKFIPKTEMLKEQIISLIELIQQNPENISSQKVQEYADLAFTLDTTLLKGLLPERKIDELIIIPDGLISAIPFEVLVSRNQKMNSFYNLDYRINDFSISYGFSSTLFFQQNKKYRKIRNPNIQLFAYSDHESINIDEVMELSDELPASSFEVDQVANILEQFTIHKWKGEDCTKGRFETVVEESDIIHLALHGKSDPTRRFGNHIIFRKKTGEELNSNRLYSHELRGLNMKAKFVFLSACEAGDGKSEIGEGIYSLGRGFANTGVPSLVMGLWKINDNASAAIVKEFYKSFKKWRSYK